MAVANVQGRLDAMIQDAVGRDVGAAPAFSPAQLHPVVWSAAAPQWTIGQRRVAVREAAETLALHWKAEMQWTGEAGTSFWEEILAESDPMPGRPRLRWIEDSPKPGAIRHGLQRLAAGLSLTVRNPSTHTDKNWPEQEAMEMLSALSHLARMLDRCQIRVYETGDREEQA